METRKYSAALGTLSILLAILWIVERSFIIRKGIFVGGSEVIIELMSAILLTRCHAGFLKDNLIARWMFFLFFVLLATADFSYIYSYYWHHLDNHDPLVVICTTLPYAMAYLSASIAIIAAAPERPIWKYPIISGICLLITTPLALQFLIFPYFKLMAHNQWSLFFVGQGLSILTSLLLINISLIGLYVTRNLFWSFFVAGNTTLVLGDWALRVETLMGHVPTFGFYEFLWAFGIYLCAIPILFFKDSARGIESMRTSSLLTAYKFWSICLIFIPIVFLCLSEGSTLQSIKILAIGCSLGSVLSILLSHFFTERIQYFSEQLANLVSDRFQATSRIEDLPKGYNLPLELSRIYDLVFEKQIRDNLIHAEKERQFRANQVQTQLAAQVAHDIRSPLAALDSILKDLAQLPEEKRIIVRSAIGRIRDIANDLLDRHRKTPVSGGVVARPDSEPASVQLLSALTERLITEKRMQYRSRTGVNIEANLNAASTPSPGKSPHALASLEGNAGAPSYGLFAKIQPTEFKRVLSNLINNSVEALGDKGSVIVTLDSEGDRVLIKVTDNGRGIPPEVLAKIGQKGETFGKAGGTGLGLYHARKALESWGGALEIKSELNKGATAVVNLPKSPTPHWFASRLILSPNSPVVVLDDDASIHQVWQERFNSLKVQDSGIDVFHFSTPQDFRSWVQGDKKQSEAALYLSDYELLGHKETGLDLAEELKTGPRTILVTSRYEEKELLKRCLKIGAQMIPKGLSAFVPIVIRACLETPDAILIDDDPLVRLTWTMSAKRAGKTASVFSGVSDFLEQAAIFDPKTPVYIDRDLGGGIKGDEEAQGIYVRGFKEIYLATGYEMENAPAPWIKEVVGKESPWAEVSA